MLRPEALDGVFWSCISLFLLGSIPFPTTQVGWEEYPWKSAGWAQGHSPHREGPEGLVPQPHLSLPPRAPPSRLFSDLYL